MVGKGVNFLDPEPPVLEKEREKYGLGPGASFG